MSTPTTNPSLPLLTRILNLTQNLQFVWFLGHSVLFLAVLRYLFSSITFNYNSIAATVSYRMAFLGATVTYGIVVYKAYRAKLRQNRLRKGAAMLLDVFADENVQYFAIAMVWLFSRSMLLAVLPFSVYSLFHIATYTRQNVLPTVFPAPPDAVKYTPPFANAIRRFSKDYFGVSMSIVAFMEAALWVRLLISAMLLSNHSWLLLMVYTVFFRTRWQQNIFVKNAVSQFGNIIDLLVANKNVPVMVRDGWAKVKIMLETLVNATNIEKYVSTDSGQSSPIPPTKTS